MLEHITVLSMVLTASGPAVSPDYRKVVAFKTASDLAPCGFGTLVITASSRPRLDSRLLVKLAPQINIKLHSGLTLWRRD